MLFRVRRQHSSAFPTALLEGALDMVTNSSAAVGWMPTVLSKSAFGSAELHGHGEALNDFSGVIAQHV